MLTTACNRRDTCEHCFYNTEPDRTMADAPDTEQVIDLLEKLRLSGLRTIVLTGGEPTLRPDLPELVDAASRFSLETVLLTNGSLLTKDLVLELSDKGLGATVVTLSRFDLVERRAANLLAEHSRMPFSFIFCFSKKTYGRIPDAMEFARDYLAPIMFQPAYIPAGHTCEQDLSMRTVDGFEWGRIYTMLRPWARNYGYDAYLKLMHAAYNGDKIGPPRCAMSGNALVVDADGRMYPCFHRRDMDCGCAWSQEYSAALAAWRATVPHTLPAPCFGDHCLSLHTDI